MATRLSRVELQHSELIENYSDERRISGMTLEVDFGEARRR